MSHSSVPEMQTVIVADDQEVNVNLLKVLVNSSVPGSHIRVESISGRDASDRVVDIIDQLGKKVCLVVTDVRMPRKEDGFKVIQHANMNGIPVFAVSGTTDDLLDGYRDMCSEIFEKPFDISSFRAAVREAIADGNEDPMFLDIET